MARTTNGRGAPKVANASHSRDDDEGSDVQEDLDQSFDTTMENWTKGSSQAPAFLNGKAAENLKTSLLPRHKPKEAIEIESEEEDAPQPQVAGPSNPKKRKGKVAPPGSVTIMEGVKKRPKPIADPLGDINTVFAVQETREEEVVEDEPVPAAVKTKPPSKANGKTTTTTASNGKAPAPKKADPKGKAREKDTSAEMQQLQFDLEDANRKLERSEREIQLLKDEVTALKLERNDFSKKFSILSKLRSTEPERLFEDLREATNQHAQAQETLIEQLKTGISGLAELTQDGHVSGLQFLTREDTDRRIREVQAQSKAKDQRIKTLEEENAEYKVQVVTLKSDLDLEKQHFAQELARKPNPARPAPSSTNNNGPKYVNEELARQSDTIRFLQDLCGVLVLNVQAEPLPQDGHSVSIRCLFTVDESDALGFRVVIYPPSENGDQEYMYEPLLTDRPLPSDEFIHKLAWLGTSFSFPSTQAHMLGRQLLALKDKPESDEEGEEEGVSEVIDVDEM